MPRFVSVLLMSLLLAAVAFAQSRPVDTLQFGLLSLGMSAAEVERRLGPPSHVETATRTALVPVRDRFARRRHAPAYVVRTTEVAWWYYPGGRGLQETRLEFRNGYLSAKNKYR